MTDTQIFWLIAGMSLLTYIPRALPALFAGKIKPSVKTEKFLRLIPYTAMSALIFPGILSVDPQRWYDGVAGGALAALLAWKKVPMIACVISAIALVWIVLLLL